MAAESIAVLLTPEATQCLVSLKVPGDQSSANITQLGYVFLQPH